jgi:hypothetical protein
MAVSIVSSSASRRTEVSHSPQQTTISAVSQRYHGLERPCTCALTQCTGCDTAIAANGTSTVAPAYGLPDTDNTMCSQGCRLSSSSDRSTTEACGNNPTDGNIQRLSLYEFVVSGFRNNACVLKLNLNLLFLFFCYVLHRFDLTTRERLRIKDMEVEKVYMMGNGRVRMGVSKDEQVAREARAWVSWICNGILQDKGASPVGGLSDVRGMTVAVERAWQPISAGQPILSCETNITYPVRSYFRDAYACALSYATTSISNVFRPQVNSSE